MGSITAHATPGGVKTATCTYSFSGKTVAQRTAAAGKVKLSFIISDSVNTGQSLVQPTSGTTLSTATTRFTDPFGLARGATHTAAGNTAYTTAPSTANGNGSNAANLDGFGAANGYIKGLADTASGLTHLGARDLDPVLGAFTAPDPLLDTSSSQFSAYLYAAGDPINYSDPSGLYQCGVVAVTCVPGSTSTSAGGGALRGLATYLGIPLVVALLLQGVGIVSAPPLSDAYLADYKRREWANVPQDPFVNANAALSFDSPGVGSNRDSSGSPAFSSGSRSYRPYVSSGRSSGISTPKSLTPPRPWITSMATAAAARKSSEAKTAAIGNATQAETAASGGNGSANPPGGTGLADPGDDDWDFIAQILQRAQTGRGFYGLGSATRGQANAAGESWVGPGARLASDGKTRISMDKLRQYRPPSFKNRTGFFQANFESRPLPKGAWPNNGHLDILGGP